MLVCPSVASLTDLYDVYQAGCRRVSRQGQLKEFPLARGDPTNSGDPAAPSSIFAHVACNLVLQITI
jgi:hypothetical protein